MFAAGRLLATWQSYLLALEFRPREVAPIVNLDPTRTDDLRPLGLALWAIRRSA